MPRDPAPSREAILKAGRAARGAGRELHLNEIARDAGVGVGTVYRHFPTPRELRESLVLASLDELRRRAELIDLDSDPGGVRAFLSDAILLVAQQPDFAAVALDKAPALEEVARARAELIDAVAALVDRARTEGIVNASFSTEEILALICGVAYAAQSLEPAAGRASRFADALIAGITVA